jgi:hypothetical protein
VRIERRAVDLSLIRIIKDLHLNQPDNLIQIHNNFTRLRHHHFKVHIFLLLTQRIVHIVALFKIYLIGSFVTFSIDSDTYVDLGERMRVNTDVDLAKGGVVVDQTDAVLGAAFGEQIGVG